MTDKKTDMLSRRRFLGYSALGLSGLTILPTWVNAQGLKIAPSDRFVLGFIGLGQQGCSDFWSFSHCPGVQVVAGADVDSIKRERFKRRVEGWQTKNNVNPRCDTYEFYQDLLERRDIDAVSIATPDHWHALATIHACQAKKDVYVQKPLSYTMTEAWDMVKAVRDNGCILQVGSQQRTSKEFMQAIAIIRSRVLGDVQTIYAKVGDPPKPYDLPEQPIPPNLNWNQWLGPLSDPAIHYNADLCPPVTLEPEKNEQLWGAWRWYRETGNGYTADWGAHMFDISQAAIGMDGLGPCEYIPKGYKNTEYLTMKYENGIVMTEQPFKKDAGNGIRFNCSKGWLMVTRGYIECSDSSVLKKEQEKVEKGQYEVSSPHMQNFIDAVKSRKDPMAPVEAGCSTAVLCCLANIATELQRPVKYDPALRSLGDDIEAKNHRLYKYQYRRAFTV